MIASNYHNSVEKTSRQGNAETSGRGFDSGGLIDNLNIDLLSIEKVAAVLGKKPQTIKNWIAKRIIPFVRIGNKNLILRESLEAWIKQKEFKPWQ